MIPWGVGLVVVDIIVVEVEVVAVEVEVEIVEVGVVDASVVFACSWLRVIWLKKVFIFEAVKNFLWLICVDKELLPTTQLTSLWAVMVISPKIASIKIPFFNDSVTSSKDIFLFDALTDSIRCWVWS